MVRYKESQLAGFWYKIPVDLCLFMNSLVSSVVGNNFITHQPDFSVEFSSAFQGIATLILHQ